MAELSCPPDCAAVAWVAVGTVAAFAVVIVAVGYLAYREVLSRRRKGTIGNRRQRSIIYFGFTGPLGLLNNWPDIRRYCRLARSARGAAGVGILVLAIGASLSWTIDPFAAVPAFMIVGMIGFFWVPAVFIQRAVENSGGLPPEYV